MKKSILIDGTAEGLFTAVYRYYYGKLRPDGIYDRAAAPIQQAIGEEYEYLETCAVQAGKVFDAIEAKLSRISREHIFRALSSFEADRLYDIFRYVLLAFRKPRDVDLYEQLDFVLRVHKLSRYVGSEAHNLKGFLRFRKTGEGVLYADVSPKNNVLAILCWHFQDRLGGERWVIHDVSRGLAGMYDTNECVITSVPDDVKFDEDMDERGYQELWTAFYRTIAIRERNNSSLRRNNSPKHFWKHMTEHKLRFYDE